MGEKLVELNNASDKKLLDLAKQLSYNYINISQRSDHKFAKKMVSNILNETEEYENSYRNNLGRNILVIGAGATYDSYDGIPLATKAADMLKKYLGFRQDINDDRFKERFMTAASAIYKGYSFNEVVDKLDFENWLEIFSKVYSKGEVKGAIQKIYNCRYLPTIKYEIIAHLFKHRFIDIIINFNFDELLEQALEEELGKDNYFSIISDGDCLELDELMTDNRLKIPIYIKPHGTASHKSTLRFTKDSYMDIPKAIEGLMYNLISGKVASNNFKQNISKVNLITMGFGMQSIEFNKIIRDSYNAYKDSVKYEFYNFNIAKPIKDSEGSDDYIAEPIIGRDSSDPMRDMASTTILVGHGSNRTMDQQMHILWDEISRNFKPPYEPRCISRHLFISDVFYKKKWLPEFKSVREIDRSKGYYANGDYYYDRLIAELIIELAKGKGDIDLKKLITGRVGIYYNLFSKSDKREIPITLICKDKLGLSEAKSYANNVYSIKEKERNSDKFINLLFDKFVGNIKNEKVRNEVAGNRDNLEDYLRKLYKSFTADIKPKFEDQLHLLFSSFKRRNVLHTNLSLTVTCNEVLKNLNKWDTVLVISERGKIVSNWIKDKELESVLLSGKKRIFLITSDISENELEIDRKFLIGGKVFKLPYYAHNNHMVMFLSEVDYPDSRSSQQEAYTECGRFQFKRTNYFLKEGLGNNINPIVFEHKKEFEDDQRLLLRIFCSYYMKSLVYMDKQTDGDQHILHIDNADKLNNEIVEMFKIIPKKTVRNN